MAIQHSWALWAANLASLISHKIELGSIAPTLLEEPMSNTSILGEFKDFIIKGNAISLAVGVIIGAAFGKFVSAFTTGIVEPLLKAIGGNPEVALKIWIFDIGIIISALISLVITGAILFFIFVRPMNKLMTKEAPPAPGPSAEEKLLTEIRDLLSKRA
jgi:large conductance mechanosensitive channel